MQAELRASQGPSTVAAGTNPSDGGVPGTGSAPASRGSRRKPQTPSASPALGGGTTGAGAGAGSGEASSLATKPPSELTAKERVGVELTREDDSVLGTCASCGETLPAEMWALF